MTEHVNIPDSQRHEAKGASTAVDKTVIKSKGDGTTEFDFVDYSEITNVPVAAPVSGVDPAGDLTAALNKINEVIAALKGADLMGD